MRHTQTSQPFQLFIPSNFCDNKYSSNFLFKHPDKVFFFNPSYSLQNLKYELKSPSLFQELAENKDPPFTPSFPNISSFCQGKKYFKGKILYYPF